MSDSVHETFHALLGNTWLATGYGTPVDLQYYFVTPGKRELCATLVAAHTLGSAATDTGSLAIQVQEGADSVTFTDITGAVFSTLTNASSAAVEDIYFALKTGSTNVRLSATVVGTPSFFGAAILSVIKRQA